MPAKRPAYLTTLTPLRGIAALLVVIFHCNLMLMPFVPPGYTNLVSNGWLWVDFFFMLSGFIMCYVYGKYFTRRVTWAQYKKYIGARFARVYPLHFFTTIWALICIVAIINKASNLDPFFNVIFNPKALPACLLLIQSLHIYITPPLNTPSWSLSTEWWMYMIFPFMVPVFANLKKRGKLATLFLLILFYLFLRYIIGPMALSFGSPKPTLNLVSDFGLFRCLAGFLAGMLLFGFYRDKAGYAVLKSSWCFIAFFLAALLCMHFGAADIIILAFFPFILISAAYNSTQVKRLLDTTVLQRLGDWSFSIYMVHVPLIWMFTILAVNKNPAMFGDLVKLLSQKPDYQLGAMMCMVVVALTILIASLTYRFIEVPARNYLNDAFKTKERKIRAVDTEYDLATDASK